METYSNLLVDEEHDREYRRLIVQESIFENELYVMDKNAAEIETLMKQAFYLYKAMERLDVDEELKSCALDLSLIHICAAVHLFHHLGGLRDLRSRHIHLRRRSESDPVSYTHLEYT